MRIEAPTYSLRDLLTERPAWRRDRQGPVGLTGESRSAERAADALPGTRPVPAESAGRAEDRPEERGRRSGGETGEPNALPGRRGLTADEEREVARLKAIDRQVRAHEQAHLAAAGGIARGGASLSFVTGPDGRQYAVAGEVQIDTSAVSGSPEQTLMKARMIESAALAPADPSPADRRIAAQARQMALEARQQAAARQPTGSFRAASATGVADADTPAEGAGPSGAPGDGPVVRSPDPRIRAYTLPFASTSQRGQAFAQTV